MNADQYQKETLSLGGLNFVSRFTDDYDEFLHTHEFYEIFFIRYGKIKHCIANQTRVMTTGDACLVSPGIKHKFLRMGECAHRDIMISAQLFKRSCDYVDEKLFGRIQQEKIIKFSISQKQIENFESSYLFYSESEKLEVKHVYENVLCAQILGILDTNTQIDSQPSVFQNKCTTLITEHLHEKDVLKNAYENLGYTQGHFCKKFKAEFNMTPTDYVNLKRINSAAELLMLSNTSVEACCYQVGFESLPYFIKLFKKHYGTTPAKYKRENHRSPPPKKSANPKKSTRT